MGIEKKWWIKMKLIFWPAQTILNRFVHLFTFAQILIIHD